MSIVIEEKDDFFSNFDEEIKGNASAPSEPTVDQSELRQDVPKPAAASAKPQRRRIPKSVAQRITIGGLIFSGVAILTLVILAATVGEDFAWETWQWLIGTLGAAAGFFLVGIAIYWIDDKDFLDYQLPVTVLLIAAAIANFALRCYMDEEAYKIIFICIGILCCATELFFVFHMWQFPWIVTLAIGLAFSIAFLVSGWIMPEWEVWQWIIGVMVSVLFLAPCFVMEYYGKFLLYMLNLFFTAIVLAVNFILIRNYGEDYRTIFILLSSSALLGTVGSIASRHVKGDGAWGKVQIAPLIGGAILLILGLVLK